MFGKGAISFFLQIFGKFIYTFVFGVISNV